MKIRHILVEHKYQALDILRWLKEGRPFEELAKKYSSCPSSRNGGDLGDLRGKTLDEDFAFAADSLKVGEISEVVRTRFGYHLLKRES